MGQKETVVTNKNRIMIYGPKNDGTYIVEFKTADGEELAISVPRNETAVLKHFQERMPYGLFVPDFREEPETRPCVAWAGPSLESAFLDGPQAPPELPPFQNGLGRGSGFCLANHRRASVEHSPLRGRYGPKGAYKSKGR
jgi:hypothetical protein